jgi:glycosyltransferase involved in cell wall biosynthesis
VVSVVIPARDVGRYVAKAIASALAQSIPDLEVLVVDDCSVDDTRRQAERAVDSRVRIIHGEGRGCAAARNRATALATSQYVAFLDGDDVWRPYHLARLTARLDACPELDLVFAASNWIDQYDNPIPRTVVRWNGAISYEQLFLEFAPVTTSALCLRREALLAVGGFDETLRAGVDHDLCLRVALLRPGNCAGVAEIGLDYRRRPGQITADRSRKALAWASLVEKHAALAPECVARLGRAATANHHRALAASAYEDAAFAEARAWFARAIVAAPVMMIADRRTWISGAAVASTLLPSPAQRWIDRAGRRFLATQRRSNFT